MKTKKNWREYVRQDLTNTTSGAKDRQDKRKNWSSQEINRRIDAQLQLNQEPTSTQSNRQVKPKESLTKQQVKIKEINRKPIRITKLSKDNEWTLKIVKEKLKSTKGILKVWSHNRRRQNKS